MNFKTDSRALLATASLAAIIATSAPLHAQENTSDAAQDNGGDVIIVTANRREESIQDAAMAITAFGGEELASRSITAIEQVGAIAPGVQIATYQGDTSIFIRGIGTPTIIAGTDSSTATYVDGVYISRPAAIGPLFFDIDRIEVLRGPQGTLYGRNATGGAVNIVTSRPTDHLAGNLQLTVGNHDRFRVAGALSGPLNDAIRARLAFQWEDRDGYATVIRPDNSTEKVEDKEDYSVRLTVEADLSPDAMITLSGDYYRADDKANAYFYASAGYADEIPGWYGTREGSQTLPYFGMKNSGRVSPPASRVIYADVPYFNKVENWGLGATLDWDIADYNLKVIGSYRDTNPVSQNEFDLSDAFVNIVGREEDHWQWSGEVQLSSPADKPFSWIAGAYYFEERNIIDNDIFGNFWEPDPGFRGSAGSGRAAALSGGLSRKRPMLRTASQRRTGHQGLGRLSRHAVGCIGPVHATAGRALQRRAARRAAEFRSGDAARHADRAKHDLFPECDQRGSGGGSAGPVRFHHRAGQRADDLPRLHSQAGD